MGVGIVSRVEAERGAVTGADAPAMNSAAYWDRRFGGDWADQGGNEQTRRFMELLVRLLPENVRETIERERLEILDWGCAEGEGVPVLERCFPRSPVIGVDISEAAIARARTLHPGSTFRRADLLAGAERTDVIVCSNVLEHFADPRAVLEALARHARHAVVVLVPFLEDPLIDEHEASFTHDSFPLQLGDGKRLVFARSVDLRWRRRSPWPGMQMLAIYSGRGDDSTLADLNQFTPVLTRVRDCQRAVERLLRPLYRVARVDRWAPPFRRPRSNAGRDRPGIRDDPDPEHGGCGGVS